MLEIFVQLFQGFWWIVFVVVYAIWHIVEYLFWPIIIVAVYLMLNSFIHDLGRRRIERQEQQEERLRQIIREELRD